MKYGTISWSYTHAKGGLPKLQASQSGGGSVSPQAALTRLVELYNQGKLAEVIARGETLVASNPSLLLYNLLGTANARQDRLEQAVDCFQKALRLQPNALAYNNLGDTLRKLGRVDEAIACFEDGLAIDPDDADLQNNLGAALQEIGRINEALTCYEHVLALKPNDAEAHYKVGSTLQKLGRADEAVIRYDHALAIRPAYPEAHYNQGIALLALGRTNEVIACFERALAIRPDFAHARSRKLFQQAHRCDWEAIRSEAALIPSLGVEDEGVIPFLMLALEDAPERHRIRSENFAARSFQQGDAADFVRPSNAPNRLRIGYFSAEFHDHATMYLMVRLLELHDDSRFELYAYSYGPDDDGDMRRRVKDAVHVFRDVRAMDDRGIAELARRDGLDIAVDLKGYTSGARLGIFAWRAAPVQLSYLGYPGTLGAPFIDYIVADRIVIPEEMRQHYSESVIYLPDSYQANDDTRAIADRTMTRAEMGLPDTGFVFCCFNNSYKISAQEFDIWMRLLERVEGSVLWLLEEGPSTESNLRMEAQKRGIDPDRLVFAEKLPQAEHLARQRLADLFLDTFNVNAHTTASDALWAGLPIVTKLGKGFAARVAGSLLEAVGLPELVTTTSEEYEALALRLAMNSSELSEVKSKLAANRLTTPLFDSELFVRHIELSYETAYRNYYAGHEPRDIVITDLLETAGLSAR